MSHRRHRPPPLVACWAAVLLCGTCGCRPLGSTAPSEAKTAAASFRDLSSEAGLAFELGHHGRSPLTILDTLGQGCAFVDYDGDGLLDALLVSDHGTALFRNRGDGHF